MKTYLVGGAVRDKLLDRPVTEKDWVVVGATPQQLIDQGYRQVGKDFPVFLHPESQEEYALARTERKQGTGYYGFSCDFNPDITLEQDLLRRDLTINAIAQDSDGGLIDPYGGQQDLEHRTLRHVSDAFVEDPLRVLRVARFAARYHGLGFTVAAETNKLMASLSESGELKSLTAERVWKETERALLEPWPHIYFETLRACGALAEIFPEIDCLWGIPNPAQWHPEIDSGIHTMMVLEQAAKLSDRLDVRFSALCHDLGKGVTPKNEWPSHRGHEKAGVAIIEALAERLRIPKKIKQLAQLTSEFHLHVHRAFQLKATTLVSMLEQLGAFRNVDGYYHFLLACQADFLGRTGFENRPYPQQTYLLDVYKVASLVTAKPFVEQGYQGETIKQKIYQERVSQVKKLINEYALPE